MLRVKAANSPHLFWHTKLMVIVSCLGALTQGKVSTIYPHRANEASRREGKERGEKGWRGTREWKDAINWSEPVNLQISSCAAFRSLLSQTPTLSLASHSLPLQCTRLHCPGSLSLPVSSFSDYLPLLSNVLYLPLPPVIRVYPLLLSSDSISIPQPPVSRISLLPLASRISHLPLPPWFRVSLHSLTLSCPAAATLAAAITLISHVN